MDAQFKYLTAQPQRTKCASGDVVDLCRVVQAKKKKEKKSECATIQLLLSIYLCTP